MAGKGAKGRRRLREEVEKARSRVLNLNRELEQQSKTLMGPLQELGDIEWKIKKLLDRREEIHKSLEKDQNRSKKLEGRLVNAKRAVNDLEVEEARETARGARDAPRHSPLHQPTLLSYNDNQYGFPIGPRGFTGGGGGGRNPQQGFSMPPAPVMRNPLSTASGYNLGSTADSNVNMNNRQNGGQQAGIKVEELCSPSKSASLIGQVWPASLVLLDPEHTSSLFATSGQGSGNPQGFLSIAGAGQAGQTGQAELSSYKQPTSVNGFSFQMPAAPTFPNSSRAFETPMAPVQSINSKTGATKANLTPLGRSNRLSANSTDAPAGVTIRPSNIITDPFPYLPRSSSEEGEVVESRVQYPTFTKPSMTSISILGLTSTDHSLVPYNAPADQTISSLKRKGGSTESDDDPYDKRLRMTIASGQISLPKRTLSAAEEADKFLRELTFPADTRNDALTPRENTVGRKYPR